MNSTTCIQWMQSERDPQTWTIFKTMPPNKTDLANSSVRRRGPGKGRTSAGTRNAAWRSLRTGPCCFRRRRARAPRRRAHTSSVSRAGERRLWSATTMRQSGGPSIYNLQRTTPMWDQEELIHLHAVNRCRVHLSWCRGEGSSTGRPWCGEAPARTCIAGCRGTWLGLLVTMRFDTGCCVGCARQLHHPKPHTTGVLDTEDAPLRALDARRVRRCGPGRGEAGQET